MWIKSRLLHFCPKSKSFKKTNRNNYHLGMLHIYKGSISMRPDTATPPIMSVGWSLLTLLWMFLMGSMLVAGRGERGQGGQTSWLARAPATAQGCWATASVMCHPPPPVSHGPPHQIQSVKWNRNLKSVGDNNIKTWKPRTCYDEIINYETIAGFETLSLTICITKRFSSNKL